MVPLDADAFHARLPAKGRLMALDVGVKTIGVAISDVERTLVEPVDTILRRKFRLDVEALRELVATHAAIGLIIGYPLNMDGTPSPRCQSVRAFQRDLEAIVTLPMLLWDERQSSLEAENWMEERGVRSRDKGDLVDKLAAVAILQSFLKAEYPARS